MFKMRAIDADKINKDGIQEAIIENKLNLYTYL